MTTTPTPHPNLTKYLDAYYADVLDCGHKRETPKNFHPSGVPMTSGYATEASTGRRVCYGCAWSAEEHEMLAVKPGGGYTAYVSDDTKEIVTWTGGTLMIVHAAHASKAFGRPILNFRAIDAHGHEWYGKNGGAGRVIRMKRVAG